MAISDTLKGEAWAVESDLPLVLLEINHADLAAPIRVVNNTVDITSGGDVYSAFAFEIRLPDALEDAPPRARLRISNVSREIAQAIRDITSAADVTIEVVRQDDPDTIEVSWPAMRLTNVRWDFLTVEGDLEFEDLTREPYPFLSFSPAEFPGVVQ